jgi:choline dehydrogenase-like flavoprotein
LRRRNTRANYWRFHEIDFHERSVLGSISGTGFADWPISYQELEPYYTKVEWEVGVSRLAGAQPLRSVTIQALTCLPGGGTYRTFCAPQRNLM